MEDARDLWARGVDFDADIEGPVGHHHLREFLAARNRISQRFSAEGAAIFAPGSVRNFSPAGKNHKRQLAAGKYLGDTDGVD